MTDFRGFSGIGGRVRRNTERQNRFDRVVRDILVVSNGYRRKLLPLSYLNLTPPGMSCENSHATENCEMPRSIALAKWSRD